MMKYNASHSIVLSYLNDIRNDPTDWYEHACDKGTTDI